MRLRQGENMRHARIRETHWPPQIRTLPGRSERGGLQDLAGTNAPQVDAISRAMESSSQW